MLTVEQCRSARGLLGWTQQDLAEASGLSKTAINNFEKGRSDIKAESLNAVQVAFESADIEFLGHDGLRRKTDYVRMLRGAVAINDIFGDINALLREGRTDIMIRNMHADLEKHIFPEKREEHMALLAAYGENTPERLLCAQGQPAPSIPGARTRWLPEDSFEKGVTTFLYGDKLAIGLWEHVLFMIVSNMDAYKAERRRFEGLWASAQALPAEDTARQDKRSGHS
ncbi:MAG: helix-turn-helix transcriptional regulator [Alphaproteobacteria bacterium]|nr:helix-turn-helix transcriptional regulator [Alphaproteobacteria bacterium]